MALRTSSSDDPFANGVNSICYQKGPNLSSKRRLMSIPPIISMDKAIVETPIAT